MILKRMVNENGLKIFVYILCLDCIKNDKPLENAGKRTNRTADGTRNDDT